MSETNNLELPVETLGIPWGWVKGTGDWAKVNAVIARGDLVQVIQEAGSTLWRELLPPVHPFYFGFPEIHEFISPQARIWISSTKRKFHPQANFPKVQWHPRVLWVGIGCTSGVPTALIVKAVAQVCQRYHLATEAIAGIATVDHKADEVGILEYCRQSQLPLKSFSKETLAAVNTPNPSALVALKVKTPSVAEAAASCLGDLLVPKQVVKSLDSSLAVTLAISQAAKEVV